MAYRRPQRTYQEDHLYRWKEDKFPSINYFTSRGKNVYTLGEEDSHILFSRNKPISCLNKFNCLYDLYGYVNDFDVDYNYYIDEYYKKSNNNIAICFNDKFGNNNDYVFDFGFDYNDENHEGSDDDMIRKSIKGIVWFKHLFSEKSIENIDMDFYADLAFLMPKLMIKKKWPSPYVKWCPRGGSRGGSFAKSLINS